MALKSIIYKAALTIADVDRHYYAEHTLTLARHPSETDERLMIRLLAFILFADDRLTFGRGLSEEGEPDLSLTDDAGNMTLWIEVGLPTERAMRRAAGRANQVVLFTYGGKIVETWRQKEGNALAKLDKLTIINILPNQSAALVKLALRSMHWQCTLQDGVLLINDEHNNIALNWPELQRSTSRKFE